MDLLHFSTTKTACVYTLGNIENNTATVWILIHGYAQKGDVFLHSFQDLLHENMLLVAPEALNKFYTKGGYGNVVASWMTKDNRENEIENYVAYIENVVTYFQQRGFSKFNILGFSQGVATVSRFLKLSSIVSFDTAVLWAGEIPAEVDYNQLSNFEKLFYICGDNDPFFKATAMQEKYSNIAKMQFMLFEGGHVISTAVLKKIFSD